MAGDRLWLLAVLSIITAPIQGQDPVGSDVARQLEELRKRNEALEARVTALETGNEDGGLTARYGEVTATFKVFGDVGFSNQNPEDADRAHSHFFLGSVDFFANVQMGDRFRILSETVLDARGGESISADQERLWAMWTVSDALYLKLGTEHSPISRWNQLYHHGLWLETSISRPLLARFEGSEGILAMHATGLELGGRQQTSAGGLEWFLTLANGRGSSPSQKQRTNDLNDSKKTDVGLAFMPSAVPDLRVGTAFTYDEIPADPAATPAPGQELSIQEFLTTVHAQYRCGPLDLMAEFAWIQHEARALDSTFHHHSGYLQAALHSGQFTPYARMDFREMELGDPFYLSNDRDLDVIRPVAGLRFDASENMATKLEIAVEREEDRLGGGSVDHRTVVILALQVSWVL